MKNKIAVISVIISVIVYFGFSIIKFFPSLNIKYNPSLVSFQMLVLTASFTIVLFVMLGYSWLTYIMAFITYGGLYATIYKFIFHASANYTSRILIYVVGLILTIITFYILKKLKVNLPQSKRNV